MDKFLKKFSSFHLTVTFLSIIFLLPAAGCRAQESKVEQEENNPKSTIMNKSEKEWKQLLTPSQYHILREAGTERPFTGKYESFFEKGTYVCAGCGNELFESSTKYHSGCGWPSFFDVKSNKNITLHRDTSFGMVRTEIRCARCGGHLGHIFEDGPEPTGLRYCINSEALRFIPDSEKK